MVPSSSSPRASAPPADGGAAPVVSVVIPCYGQARFLGDALASVRAQTHGAWEIIVVDDGSPDDVPAALADFPEVALVRRQHGGPSAARNAGLQRARGEFVAFLDADDVLYPDALQRGIAALAECPTCAFAAGGHTVREGGAIVRTYVPATDLPPYEDMLRRNFIGMIAAVLFRRDALTAVGGFRDELRACEDLDLFLRLLRGGSVVLHDGVIAEYRRHASNSSYHSARMYAGLHGALGAQRRFVRGRPELRRAYEDGLASGRALFAEPVLDAAKRALRQRRDVAAAAGAVALLVRLDFGHYTRRFARALLRRATGAPPPGAPARVRRVNGA